MLISVTKTLSSRHHTRLAGAEVGRRRPHEEEGLEGVPHIHRTPAHSCRLRIPHSRQRAGARRRRHHPAAPPPCSTTGCGRGAPQTSHAQHGHHRGGRHGRGGRHSCGCPHSRGRHGRAHHGHGGRRGRGHHGGGSGSAAWVHPYVKRRFGEDGRHARGHTHTHTHTRTHTGMEAGAQTQQGHNNDSCLGALKTWKGRGQ